jgi:hypothetical protein
MRILGFLSIPLVLALSSSALAAVMVLPVEGTNLEPGEIDAIGQMVGAAYQLESKEAVIPPADVKKALDETGGYQPAAQKLGATEYIYITAVRLDQKIVITATRYSADGKLVHSAKMSATTLDDVEPASDRLAKALVNKKSATESRTIDNVTTTEERRPTRTGNQKVAGFKGSFTYPIGWKERIAPQMSGALDIRLESRSFFTEFAIGLTFPAGDYENAYGGIWLDIGASFYLSDANTAPYVGFGIMPRLMSASPANIAPYGQFGVMFFRESSTRVYSDFRIAQNILPVGFGMFDDDLNQMYPTELTLSVGMGF